MAYAIDQRYTALASRLERQGFVIEEVVADEFGSPPLKHTLGLSYCGLPELAVVGQTEQADELLRVGAFWLLGEGDPGTRFFESEGVWWRKAAPEDPRLQVPRELGRALYGEEPRFYLAVWPGRAP